MRIPTFLGRASLGLLAGLLLLLSSASVARQQPSQVQVARQFLLAILHGRYSDAYGLLSPEARTAMTEPQFKVSAKTIYRQGQVRGRVIDLYKLGVRIGDVGDSPLFYAFMFRSDTLRAVPTVQLDVTFRSETDRQILGFTTVPAMQTQAKAKP